MFVCCLVLQLLFYQDDSRKAKPVTPVKKQKYWDFKMKNLFKKIIYNPPCELSVLFNNHVSHLSYPAAFIVAHRERNLL